MRKFAFLCDAFIFVSGFCAASGSLFFSLVLLTLSALLNLLFDFLSARVRASSAPPSV